MKHPSPNRTFIPTIVLSFALLIIVSLQSGCGGGSGTNGAIRAPLPVACDSAARILTKDWLEAILTTAQKDSLKLPENRSAVSNAVDFASLESVFSLSGISNLRQRLVERRIKSDLACHQDHSISKPSYADSLIFPAVKQAIIQFLQ